MRIVIAGAGRFGRELACWMDTVSARIFVFADDTGADPKKTKSWIYPEVVGTIDGFDIEEGDRALVSVNDPKGKLAVAARLKSRNVPLTSFHHASALVAPSAIVSAFGVIMCPGALVSADAEVDELVLMNCYATVGHDARVGRGCTISSHVDICGGAEIGEEVFIGSGARILPRVRVGSRAIIGAGAVVMRNVPANATVAGNPATIIR